MMITEPVRSLMGKIPYVYVATADSSGMPHMSIGEQVTISGDSLLIFENWFCPSTLHNITRNPRVSVVAVLPDSGTGYQLLGSVVGSEDAAILNGYDPTINLPETPQVLTKFIVRVDQVLEFTGGIHSDKPMN